MAYVITKVKDSTKFYLKETRKDGTRTWVRNSNQALRIGDFIMANRIIDMFDIDGSIEQAPMLGSD